jgi:hypothetical protein
MIVCTAPLDRAAELPDADGQCGDVSGSISSSSVDDAPELADDKDKETPIVGMQVEHVAALAATGSGCNRVETVATASSIVLENVDNIDSCSRPVAAAAAAASRRPEPVASLLDWLDHPPRQFYVLLTTGATFSACLTALPASWVVFVVALTSLISYRTLRL